MSAALRRRVLFLGGDKRLSSVRIRCIQVARALGCDFALAERNLVLPGEKDLFVLVKYPGPLERLRRQGKVVWDVIDAIPPLRHVDCYLFSTISARDLLRPILKTKRSHVIPHHHCNFEDEILTPHWPRRVAWIGDPIWKPKLTFRHSTVNSTAMNGSDLQTAFRGADILINLRRCETVEGLTHRMLGTGIKLINAIGFGLPSVSSPEAAYYELAPECTLFASPAEAAEQVRRLRRDRELYEALRQRALAKSPMFSLKGIVKEYQQFLSELATQ